MKMEKPEVCHFLQSSIQTSDHLVQTRIYFQLYVQSQGKKNQVKKSFPDTEFNPCRWPEADPMLKSYWRFGVQLWPLWLLRQGPKSLICAKNRRVLLLSSDSLQVWKWFIQSLFDFWALQLDKCSLILKHWLKWHLFPVRQQSVDSASRTRSKPPWEFIRPR